MEKAREVLRFYRDYARGWPDEMLAAAALMTSPEGVPVAVDHRQLYRRPRPAKR